MTQRFTCWLLPAALWAAAHSAAAQTPIAAPAPADPLDAQATVPAPVYRSSLRGPRPPAAPPDARPTIPWREANDTVARIGGWRAYAREAQPPALAP